MLDTGKWFVIVCCLTNDVVKWIYVVTLLVWIKTGDFFAWIFCSKKRFQIPLSILKEEIRRNLFLFDEVVTLITSFKLISSIYKIKNQINKATFGHTFPSIVIDFEWTLGKKCHTRSHKANVMSFISSTNVTSLV